MEDTLYFIAFDTGGTKTDGVLFTQDGTVLRHTVTPGANPLDLGFETACERYKQCIQGLRAGLDAPIRCIYASIACIEYFGDRVKDYLQTLVPGAVIRTESDGNCLISAMIGHRDGACMICGTGSALCYRFGEESGHIGGWGYLVDSCGSGFILGKKALLAMVRTLDGRDGPTLMTELFEQRVGTTLHAHYEQIYAGGRPYIASFASLVFEARRRGDRAAALIFDEGIRDLAELVWTGYRRFGGGYRLILNGGIFQHYPEYVQALKAHVPPEVEVMESDAAPVYGCAVEAMYDAGLDCGAAFKQRFLETC